ncbi:hypothetical protein Tco_0877269 [Tanacetum coccineum]|uniref:Uncharacterized protein n=1 Tax=Tanacetum coccineum TaxID=301880 RepID=A0ABQ5BW45_9ASTR
MCRLMLVYRSDEYSQEVLGFSNVIASGNPTPFGDSDFLLFEEADSFLALEDDPTSSEVDPTYQDPEGDILLLEAILNSEPPPPLPNHEQYMPGGVRSSWARRFLPAIHSGLLDIARPMTHLLEKEGLRLVFSETHCGGSYAPKSLILKFEDKKGAENLAADHLSRLENLASRQTRVQEINEAFPLETLLDCSSRFKVIRRCVSGQEALDISKLPQWVPTGGPYGAQLHSKEISLISGFYWPTIYKDAHALSPL